MTTTTIRATKRRRAARASSCVFALLACWFGPAAVGVEAAEVPILTPFATAPGPQPPSPWHFTTLPNKAPTRFEVVELDGHRVLRVESDQSYGNLVHRVRVPLDSAASLAWRWRVDRLVQGADLRSRSGDDAAAKVCVFFDFPEDQLSLLERAGLAMARSVTGEDVPSEALCYVWDNRLPRGSLLPNAFTRRIRMLVLESVRRRSAARGCRSTATCWPITGAPSATKRATGRPTWLLSRSRPMPTTRAGTALPLLPSWCSARRAQPMRLLSTACNRKGRAHERSHALL